MIENKLKFRVWDKMEKRYIYPDTPGQQHYILTLNGEFHNLQNRSGGDDYIVEPYIKTFDEDMIVYVGDILVSKYGTDNIPWVIEPTFEYNCGCCDTIYGYSLRERIDNCKVIGNINENPELLKE